MYSQKSIDSVKSNKVCNYNIDVMLILLTVHGTKFFYALVIRACEDLVTKFCIDF